jgi:hypothetical protein
MELIRYLNDRFFTSEQLLAHCAIRADELQRWQTRRMMPKASYCLALDIACDSFLGAHRKQQAVEYYAKGSVNWIDVLRQIDDEQAAYAVFARRYRTKLGELAAAGMTHAERFAADEHIAAEWGHFLDGTYGLCTVSGLPEEIAAKEVAIAAIRELDADRNRSQTEADRARLRNAVDLLDRASSPFAPHEVARSSRRRYVDDMRAAYGL